jgi:hypothetical protein
MRRAFALAAAIPFVLSWIFPVGAGLVRNPTSLPHWWGTVDVALAFVIAVAGRRRMTRYCHLGPSWLERGLIRKFVVLLPRAHGRDRIGLETREVRLPGSHRVAQPDSDQVKPRCALESIRPAFSDFTNCRWSFSKVWSPSADDFAQTNRSGFSTRHLRKVPEPWHSQSRKC